MVTYRSILFNAAASVCSSRLGVAANSKTFSTVPSPRSLKVSKPFTNVSRSLTAGSGEEVYAMTVAMRTV